MLMVEAEMEEVAVVVAGNQCDCTHLIQLFEVLFHSRVIR